MSLKLMCRGNESCSNLGDVGDIELSTFQGSCQFLTIVLPFSITTVLSRRINFDKEYLKEFTMLGVPYTGFRSTLPPSHCAFKTAHDTSKMKKYIVDKHLKVVSIIIQNRKNQKILEKFAFRLTYNEEGDGNFHRGRNAERIASRFFKQINELPNDNSHAEDTIQILFEWEFYDTIPKNELRLHFKPTKTKLMDCRQYLSLASLKTKFHKLDVYVAYSNLEAEQTNSEEDDFRSSLFDSPSVYKRKKAHRLQLSQRATQSTSTSVCPPVFGRKISSRLALSKKATQNTTL